MQNKYTGMRQCFRMVVREEGWRGLYRGATAPLAGAMAHNANVFFSYGVAKDAVGRLSGHDSAKLPVPLVFAAGALAGIGISVVETPVDLFKIKLQGQGANVRVHAAMPAARAMLAVANRRPPPPPLVSRAGRVHRLL